LRLLVERDWGFHCSEREVGGPGYRVFVGRRRFDRVRVYDGGWFVDDAKTFAINNAIEAVMTKPPATV